MPPQRTKLPAPYLAPRRDLSVLRLLPPLFLIGVSCSSPASSEGQATPDGVGGALTTGGRGAAGGSLNSGGTGNSSADGGASASADGIGSSTGGASTTSDGGTASDGGAASDGGMASDGGAASGGATNGGAASGGDPTSPITVWIAGDSTVANGNTPCPRGWGAEIGAAFNELVTVENRAVGGRSIRTWLYDVQNDMGADGECTLALDGQGEPVLQARWTEMLSKMGTGDYLLVQFGINDGSPTCPRHVGSDAFKEGYALLARAAKERGARGQKPFASYRSMLCW